MKWALSLLLAGCSSVGSLAQPLPVDINGGDTATIDPVLKSGSDIQFRTDTQTWASADGFSYTTRGSFYVYSVKLGQRVDLYTRPTELYVLSGGSYYATMSLTFSGTEIAP